MPASATARPGVIDLMALAANVRSALARVAAHGGLCLALATTLAARPLDAQTAPATVREYDQVFATYPFDDPNPIAAVGRIYPYFRFDGFAGRSQPRSWHVVEPREIHVLDRIGGGDGFVGGLLYAVLKGWDAEKWIQFGWATGALATTQVTDYAQPADEEQVWSIWKGNARVKR